MAKISKKIIRKALNLADKAWLVVLISLIFNLNFPQITLAKNLDLPLIKIKNQSLNTTLPVFNDKEPYITTKVWVSAYNSIPNQTDSTPCITASGLDVCERAAEDIIATNYLHLPFGTKVRFPDLYGDQIFIVHDRMNKKYSNTMDIWMQNYDTARQFGRQYTRVKIF